MLSLFSRAMAVADSSPSKDPHSTQAAKVAGALSSLILMSTANSTSPSATLKATTSPFCSRSNTGDPRFISWLAKFSDFAICDLQSAFETAASFNSRTAPFEGACVGASPAAVANFYRSVVKQDHVSLTKRCRGCNSLPGDQFKNWPFTRLARPVRPHAAKCPTFLDQEIARAV